MTFSIRKKVQKNSLHVPFVLPVCINENLWEIFLCSFDLFSVCIFPGFENVLIFIQHRDRLDTCWSRRGTTGLLSVLGFSGFLSFLFFFSPHLLHWLSAVGCFVRTNTANSIHDFFFLMTHDFIRMESEWNSVCPLLLLPCQIHHMLEHTVSFS